MDAATMLRDARRAAGLSQRALAERASVPEATVALIERANVSPRFASWSGSWPNADLS